MLSEEDDDSVEDILDNDFTFDDHEDDSDFKEFPLGDENEGETHESFMKRHPEWYAQLPEDPSIQDYVKHPGKLSYCYFVRMRDNFGLKFLLMLVSAYMFVKGSLLTFIGTGQLPYCKSYLKIEGSAYQSFQVISGIPWAMKAVFGAVSDSVPIDGYHKRYYIIIVAIFGAICFCLIAAVPMPSNLANVSAFFFLLSNLEVAIVDLLCEGKYAEIMVEHPQTGADLVSWVWGCFQLGSLLSCLIIGPMADAGYIRGMFWFCVPLALQVAIPAVLGFLPEEQLPLNKRGFQFQKIKEHRDIFLLAVSMATAAIGLAVVNVLGHKYVLFIYSLVSSTILCSMSFYVLPRLLAQCVFYLFLVNASYIQINGAVDYFYMANKECLPGGPEFPYIYYATYSAIVQSVFGWLGVVFFQSVMSNWQFRHVFWVSILLKIFAGTVDIIIVKRWNLVVGVSDKLMYMMGYNIVYQVVGMMDLLAGVVLTSKLCPKNMESTVYALLAGFQNFGSGISKSVGVFFIKWAGINTTLPCNFDNLASLIFICHMILPALAIPLTFFLIPKARLTDRILSANGNYNFDAEEEVRNSIEMSSVRKSHDILDSDSDNSDVSVDDHFFDNSIDDDQTELLRN